VTSLMLSSLTCTAAFAMIVSTGILLTLRRSKPVHYPVIEGQPCFCVERGIAVVRGTAKGSLFSALPIATGLHVWGPMSANASALMGFLLGTAVYSHWLMRHWNSLDGCQNCGAVHSRLRSLHWASILLGALLLAILLNIAAAPPSP